MRNLVLKAANVLLVTLGLFAFDAWAGMRTFNLDDDPTTGPEPFTIYGSGGWRSTGGNPDTGGYVWITDSVNGQGTKIILPDIDGGAVIKAFSLKVDVRVGNAIGNAGRPADGFSISYARANDPVLDPGATDAFTGFVTGIPEAGVTRGISVCFDTWSGNPLPDGPDIEGIIVRVDNVTVLRQGLPTRNGACADITSLQTGPYDGALGLPESGNTDNLCWQPLEVTLTEDKKLTVKYKGHTYLDGFQTTFNPSAGRLVVAGRTGGANENQHVDNIELNTTPSTLAVIGSAVGTACGAGFTVTVDDSGDSVVDPATAMVQLKLNGNTLPPANTTVDKPPGSSTTTIKYEDFSNRLAAGSMNEVEVTLKDSLGVTIMGTRTFVVGPYAVIPASYAKAAGSVNTTAPGFFGRMRQIALTLFPGDPNSLANGERNLANEYINPATGAPYDNLINLGGGDTFVDDNVINWHSAGEPERGNFTSGNGFPDEDIPGIPGTTGDANNFAAEIMAYVELKRGCYKLGVNSDDGFQALASRDPRDVLGVVLGSFNGGRGAADTIFDVAVEADGIYPLRVSWWEGGGEANIEIFFVDSTGAKFLLNDLAVGEPIKTYRDSTVILPYARRAAPYPTQILVDADADIIVELVDGNGVFVDDMTITMSLDGSPVAPMVSSAADVTTVKLPSSGLWPPGSTHRVTLTYSDTRMPPVSTTYSYEFSVAPYATLSADIACKIGSENAAEPGFRVRTWQWLPESGFVANQNHWVLEAAEGILAGLFGPNIANLDGSDPDGYFGVEGVINQNQDAPSGVGNFFAPDFQDNPVPGIPGTTGSNEEFASEVLTYVKFTKAGYYGMGVNSDDGFRVTPTHRPGRQAMIVTAPSEIAGPVGCVPTFTINGGIGPLLPTTPITAEVVYTDPANACSDIVNGAAVNGKIALIDRGVCTFASKILRAQAVGARAVIIIQHTGTQNGFFAPPFIMGGDATGINIPAVMISRADGDRLKEHLGSLVVSLSTDDNLRLGEFNGGRGASDTIFGLVVPAPGIYPLRCMWQENLGGANVEWFSVARNAASRILLNDANNADALATFRSVMQPTIGIARVDADTARITFTGVLEAADNVEGPYTKVNGATSPRDVDLTAAKKFWRSRCNNPTE